MSDDAGEEVSVVASDEDSDGLSMPLLLFFGLVMFFAWASIFEIDQTVRTNGAIIPSGRTQIVQAANAGVLAEILVKEGDAVIEGQILAILEKRRISATFEESRSKVASLSVALVRAEAEASGQDPVFGEKFKSFSVFVEAQKRLYEQRKQSLSDEIEGLKSGLSMARAVLGMQENLMASGSTSELEVMNARQKVDEGQRKITNTRNKYLSKVHQEITKLEAELDIAKYKQDERQSVLEHTEIKAPVTGIIKYLKFNTLGGVLRSGDELMQISPTEDGMIVEIKINPVDIGQLSLDMPVSIKLDAFDYSIYGGLSGTLSYISSDTLVENSNNQAATYYRAQVTLDEDSKKDNDKLADITLKPGMTASIDIQTNKRTVLAYLAKPITRAFGGAFTER
ncbi:MAG: hypothetical protein A6F72_05020 [Cycloclasticus sp. symbiont of Poecilosclerida sp. N]|nr:MAG: hypothetical protein A6F72_05020 [Cycloclasticus sp. symbiont of Poecilosclerida sp. N]